MKRKDIEAGGEYATDTGVRVRVVDLEPGWTIDPDTKDWVEAKTFAKRHVKDKGFIPYQTNINIKALVVDEDRKTVVEPRHLVGTWEEYATSQEAARQQAELVQGNAEALMARAAKAGVEPRVDPDRQEVVMDFDGFDRLLRKAKV